MGIVTDYLTDLLNRQVKNSGLVVWFDPEQHYVNVAASLPILNASVVCYEGSFFGLRHAIESYMSGDQPPRLIIYLPLDEIDTEQALVELTTAGVVIKPGQQPPTRNTRLSIIARNALRTVMNEETIAAIEKQVEENKLNLLELDALADKGKGIIGGVIVTIYGTSVPQDVALAFLSNPVYDSALLEKKALPELKLMLGSEFDLDLIDVSTPEALRNKLARYILTTDLVAGLQDKVPSSLSTVLVAVTPAQRADCVNLARTWRMRRDLRTSYVELSELLASELALSNLTWTLEQAEPLETFLKVEEGLQTSVEAALLAQASESLVTLSQRRQSSFWSEVRTEVQARWALIRVAGQVLVEAIRIDQALKHKDSEINHLLAAYTKDDAPWCLLDMQYRHMERRYHDFEFGADNRHNQLELLVLKAREAYMQVGAQLAERFIRAYQQAHFLVNNSLAQWQIYTKRVKPHLSEGKVAYLWVDALRYEMALELAKSITNEFTVSIESALATVPTITAIGMASLLPMESPPKVVPIGDGHLALRVGNTIVKSRADRVKYLSEHAGVVVYETKLDSLLPKPKKKIQEDISAAQLVLVTSQEIDALCEGDNIPLARQTMNNVLRELARACHILAELGIKTIILTADHGYLFGDELGPDMKIAAPGGNTVDLHRRVWIGNGGEAAPSYLRARLADFGLNDELEIATPWNFAGFKVKGGASAYFHGGLSPQELIVPVLTLISLRQPEIGTGSDINWELVPGSAKISTRFFSVQVKGIANGLFGLALPKVRVEIRSKGQEVSRPVIASYGFEEGTGNVLLKPMQNDAQTIEPNSIALEITREIDQKFVTVYLLDASSGVELKRLDKVEVTISI